ncbi:hypothetical protein PH505_ba00530 [Pseudoalteromonas distincta]|uniref:hypothetical protein n=1 Tax=Pseudoalteromonas distincta TaxID=77608 RepID=UPI00020A0A54|nr:hypothetical protein [Pseudoalteromonas distincta]EGI72984.1 hypothetical protein PH505_ba00530 [Pseudoalteromonas distincta]
MTNLYSGDFEPYGFIYYNGSGTGYYENAGTRTTLPIYVESFRIYKFIPVGGTSSRCRCIEILKNGDRRDYTEYSDGNWTEHEYSPRQDVEAIQIYYKDVGDTATGLNFIDVTIDSFTSENVLKTTTVKTGLTAIPAAKLNIDLDPDAERLIILDRNSAKRLYYGKVDQPFISLTLPAKYGIDPLLTCLILDDDLAYTGAILDGVIAEIADLSQ